ncbi:unnamed protein product [Cladocopium goreaui]|uniref:Uncharacterized protein n=1 Tax=Cladocopium goreaui TaxID=2562237 RepID=A0A9P1G325_9DINO|nr:unnamed protein product [Cladocopium goreaui]
MPGDLVYVAEALLARHEKNREEEAERRHKAKASNALRRMARGHRLDETEQGATLQQKDMEIRNLNSLDVRSVR